MTQLLSKAFVKVSKMPEEIQDEIAQQLLEDIAVELKWDETFARTGLLL